MGSSENSPLERGSSATIATVAELLAELTLPVIEPLATDIAAMADLPLLPVPGIPAVSEEVEPVAPASQLDATWRLLTDCTDALSLLTAHRNSCAAMAAVLIERFDAASVLEGNILGFDQWQRKVSLMALRSEVAGILAVPESVAAGLIEHATSIVRRLPATLECMSSGELGWEWAVIIAEEIKLLREAGLPDETMDAFELALLGKAAGSSVQSFREKARRLRERQYPETIPARTRKAYADRYLHVGRGHDGMSWLSLYAPSPTLEGIWDQCTATARAAQGPHEQRTLTQLRADVAAALLLNQTMAENQIFAPAIITEAPTTHPDTENPEDHTPTLSREATAPVVVFPDSMFTEPAEPSELSESSEAFVPESVVCEGDDSQWLLPVFDDPDYLDPAFVAPDPWGEPGWRPPAHPPELLPTATAPEGPLAPGVVVGPELPPMPRVLPVLLIPVLSLLGETNEPAWLEGVGPVSMEVAQRLTAVAPSFYRVLTDPVSNEPLDRSPECYRVSAAMRMMLQIRDEYCQFPGCMTKATCSEVDHVQAFAKGGWSVFDNLEHLCHRHHILKHFKDDRTKQGESRTGQSPDREQVRLRGWTPLKTETGIAWTSPTGKYYPPEPPDTQPPAYPQWLKDSLTWDAGDSFDRPHIMTEPAYLAEEDRELRNNHDYQETLDREYEHYALTHPNE